KIVFDLLPHRIELEADLPEVGLDYASRSDCLIGDILDAQLAFRKVGGQADDFEKLVVVKGNAHANRLGGAKALNAPADNFKNVIRFCFGGCLTDFPGDLEREAQRPALQRSYMLAYFRFDGLSNFSHTFVERFVAFDDLLLGLLPPLF